MKYFSLTSIQRPAVSETIFERQFTVASDLAFEVFGEEAILFLASRERFITVNRSVALLLGLIINTFGEHGFSKADFCELIREQYDLNNHDAEIKIEKIMEEWWQVGIFIPAEPRGLR